MQGGSKVGPRPKVIRLSSQVPGSVPPQAPLNHLVGSRQTGLASSIHSPSEPRIGEGDCFQKRPPPPPQSLTLDTLSSPYFESQPLAEAFLSEQPLALGDAEGVTSGMHISCSLH